MRIRFFLNEEESGNDVNNFTVANAIFTACQEDDNLDPKIIAKMILLQCEQEVEE